MVRFNVGESVFATPPESLGPILQLARGAQIDAAMLAGIRREQKSALFSTGGNSATLASVPNPVSNILLGRFSRDDSMGLSDVQANMHGLQAGYQAEIARIKKMHQEEKGIMQAKIRNLVCNGPGASAPSRHIPAIHTSASATLFDLGASGPVSDTRVGSARADVGSAARLARASFGPRRAARARRSGRRAPAQHAPRPGSPRARGSAEGVPTLRAAGRSRLLQNHPAPGAARRGVPRRQPPASTCHG